MIWYDLLEESQCQEQQFDSPITPTALRGSSVTWLKCSKDSALNLVLTQLLGKIRSSWSCTWWSYITILLVALASVVYVPATNLYGRESKEEQRQYAKKLRHFIYLVDRTALRPHSPLKHNDSEELKKALTAITVKLPPQKAKQLTELLDKTLLEMNVLDITVKEPETVAPSAFVESSRESRRYQALNQLRREVIRAFEIDLIPTRTPRYLRGKTLYQDHCLACHGARGHGDGPLAPRFDGSLRSLAAQPLNSRMSAHQVYNLLLTGLPSEAMVSLENVLRGHDLWSLSYYTLALTLPQGYTCEDSHRSPPRALSSYRVLSLAQLATLTGRQWSAEKLNPNPPTPSLRKLRCKRPFAQSSQ